MNNGLVSVVIPSYNRAYCLPRAVDSVLHQTHPNVEVIIVDDGSTDDTGAVVSARYGGDPRVRYHRQQNAGISGARNAGLALATGDYVALLDSDDEWLLWKLELQIACMRAHPEVGMTWTDMLAVDPQGTVMDGAYLRAMYDAYRWYPRSEDLFKQIEPLDRLTARAAEVAPGRNFYYGDIGAQMLMGSLVHTSTVVLTRERAQAVRTFREDLRFGGEDYEYHLRTCRLGLVGYLDVSSIRYQRGNADRATRPENGVHFARHFLAVIEPILTAERDKLALPLAMQDAVLAEARAWLGEELLANGDAAAARRELYRSLRVDPRQPRTARLLLAACMPAGLRESSRRLFRAAKRARAQLHDLRGR
ncbi:MAG TPA: glycosyltransferase family 2 protein [Polyangia bacterium]|nr:glycosyltransferase family 2 protein [Polyangia bacterium]